MILLVASNKDIASLNIKKTILAKCPFVPTPEIFQGEPIYASDINSKQVRLATLTAESTYAQNLPSFSTDLDLVVFVSRHSSESGTPTLSVHTPGNLGKAELGGLPRRVSVSPAHAMRNALKALARLKENMHLDYDVSYEGTHHGPSLDVPTMFVELGSSVAQWNDFRAAEAVAQAAIEAISNFDADRAKAVLGIGGTHYNAKFTNMALEEGIAFGHMIPKYAIAIADESMLKQCVKRTLETVDRAILDWKGIKSEDKQCLVRTLEEIDLPFEKA